MLNPDECFASCVQVNLKILETFNLRNNFSPDTFGTGIAN